MCLPIAQQESPWHQHAACTGAPRATCVCARLSQRPPSCTLCTETPRDRDLEGLLPPRGLGGSFTREVQRSNKFLWTECGFPGMSAPGRRVAGVTQTGAQPRGEGSGPRQGPTSPLCRGMQEGPRALPPSSLGQGAGTESGPATVVLAWAVVTGPSLALSLAPSSLGLVLVGRTKLVRSREAWGKGAQDSPVMWLAWPRLPLRLSAGAEPAGHAVPLSCRMCCRPLPARSQALHSLPCPRPILSKARLHPAATGLAAGAPRSACVVSPAWSAHGAALARALEPCPARGNVRGEAQTGFGWTGQAQGGSHPPQVLSAQPWLYQSNTSVAGLSDVEAVSRPPATSWPEPVWALDARGCHGGGDADLPCHVHGRGCEALPRCETGAMGATQPRGWGSAGSSRWLVSTLDSAKLPLAEELSARSRLGLGRAERKG